MAMYKLFVVIHRRTDFYKLARALDELMYPEYYEEVRRRGEIALRRLHIMNDAISKLCRW